MNCCKTREWGVHHFGTHASLNGTKYAMVENESLTVTKRVASWTALTVFVMFLFFEGSLDQTHMEYIYRQYIRLCRSITSLDLITSDACCIGQSNIIWSDDWYLFVLLAYLIVVYLDSLYILNLNVSPLPWSSSNCEERTLYVHHQFSRFHSRVLFMDQLITVLWSMPCSVASRTNDPA